MHTETGLNDSDDFILFEHCELQEIADVVRIIYLFICIEHTAVYSRKTDSLIYGIFYNQHQPACCHMVD